MPLASTRQSLSGCIEMILIFFLLSFAGSQLCSCGNLIDDNCIEEERHALLKFRDSFDNYSRHVLAWEGKQCCRWKGIKCDGITGHVTKIDLSPKTILIAEKLINKDYYGGWFYNRTLSSRAMSPSLLELKHLTHLDLSLIDFQLSPIPSFVGSLKQLRYLNLSHCCFNGTVPRHLENLTNLQILDLNGVYLQILDLNRVYMNVLIKLRDQHLFVDDFTWVSQLSSLRYINMGGVHIENGINDIMKVIYNLPFLLQADFMYCRFFSYSTSYGFVNSSTLTSKVQVLNLRENNLDVIPEAFQNMTFLRSIDLSNNFIDFVPLWLGKLRFLAHLNLSRNRISGLLPTAIQNMSSLTSLDISDNNILGSIPLWLGEFTFLAHINLARNKLTSFFPAIQNITSLRVLDLSSNNLISAIPLCIIKRIQHVNLSNNRFSILQSSCPWNSTINCNLKSLDLLQDNRFQGETFGRSKNISVCINKDLLVLDLSHNELKYLTQSLGQLKNLVHLNLASNMFYGPIPLFLRNFTKLEALILEDNHFNGTIPTFFGRFSFLRVLDLSGNHLEGHIPKSLAKLQNLKSLDLSANSLEGALGKTLLGNLPNLQDLKVGMNKLSIDLAPNWLPLFQLINLNLSSCKIDTPISSMASKPKEVSQLRLIKHWPLGNPPPNMVSTKEPHYISSNKLSGTIPKSFCGSYGTVNYIQSLNLSNNSLHGELPSTLRSCYRLEILDLGNNNLHGIIPFNIWEGNDDQSCINSRSRASEDSKLGAAPIEFHFPVAAANTIVISNRTIGTHPPPITPTFDQWEKEDVKQFMKGRELDFTKNLKFVINMDLSSNNPVGFIPEVLTSLTGLVSLNLSHNSLSGEIPSKIGKMKFLESLDLSWNHLEGPLPSSMSSLTSLSHLNLSYNNFSGPIPEATNSSLLKTHPFMLEINISAENQVLGSYWTPSVQQESKQYMTTIFMWNHMVKVLLTVTVVVTIVVLVMDISKVKVETYITRLPIRSDKLQNATIKEVESVNFDRRKLDLKDLFEATIVGPLGSDDNADNVYSCSGGSLDFRVDDSIHFGLNYFPFDDPNDNEL
ncbi:receptor-like protein EIX1 [Prosopis cineraria]|uniref:receptor-like protein EIX1 n=1 Tax=Prosopis cineraria TaxID=364024 RepID=UPI0024105A3E|nr:receptor-like protein EIX1 [Prosopis cineraria]